MLGSVEVYQIHFVEYVEHRGSLFEGVNLVILVMILELDRIGLLHFVVKEEYKQDISDLLFLRS